ncbi:MAG: GSCFA domain-containing protein [Devosia sp.]
MTPRHPYEDMPDYRHWRRARGVDALIELDPVVRAGFAIAPTDKVATAGSCFAQHVKRHLEEAGFDTFVTEPAPQVLPEGLQSIFQYGVYTTRSGNIYTARQLRQLLQRAYGTFLPEVEMWEHEGALVDPFRPQVARFETPEELAADRAQHLKAVRTMVETMSVFVFTLGLTEAWGDRDGAVYPLAPGVAGGTYDPSRHRFHHFSVDDVVSDMRAAIALIREKNPEVKVVLTVSPVPLMATALDRHVLVSTTHSKAVLRVAAQTLADTSPMVDYFPSYEIVTAPHTRGRYFGPDARAVTEEGVSHVMALFLKHYGDRHVATRVAATARKSASEHKAAMEKIVDVLCDEEMLDQPRR